MALCELQYCPDLEQWHLVAESGSRSWPFRSGPMALRALEMFRLYIAPNYFDSVGALKEADDVQKEIDRFVSKGLLKSKLQPDEEEIKRAWEEKNKICKTRRNNYTNPDRVVA